MKKYQVKSNQDSENVNDDFEVIEVKVIKEKTQQCVTLIILCAIVLFLGCAAAYGAWNDDFSEISVVWTNSQPFLFLIAGFYLGAKKE